MRALALVLLVAGCSVDPAPAQLEELTVWFWSHYEDADDEAIADAIVKLHAEVKDLPADESLQLGLEQKLSKASLEGVGLHEKNDPSKAPGLLAVTVIECPLAKVEPLIYALNQDELHPDSYDTYKRAYTNDFDAYKSREASFLTWETNLSATQSLGITSATYSERIEGGARWVARSPHGPVLLSRTVLPEPATFEDDGDYFRQDYQIEVFYERAPGQTLHVFAVWREMKVFGFTSEDDTMRTIQLDNFVKWDEVVEGHCRK